MNYKHLSLALLLITSAILKSEGVNNAYSPRNLRIDGKLQEEAWQNAPVIKDFTRPDDLPIERKTEAKIVFTPIGIAFGFTSYVPKAELKVIEAPRDKYTSSDSIEVMIDTAGSGDSFKHIIITACNSVYDRTCEQGGYVGDDKWNGEVYSAVDVTDDYWTCEMLLPYRTLGIQPNDGKKWKINLCRESFGSPTAPREVSSICNGVFNSAAEFRELVVPDEIDLEPYKLDVSGISVNGRIVDGRMSLTATASLRDMAGLARELDAELLIRQPGLLPTRQVERLKLDAKGAAMLTFDNLVVDKPGKYTGVCTVRDHATHRIMLRREFPVNATYTPIRLKMVAPHYRNAIFATQNLKEVVFEATIDAPKDAPSREVLGAIRKDGKIITIQGENGAHPVQAKMNLPESGKLTFNFPVAGLPDGNLEVYVAFGKDEVTQVLRKLPYKKGEVWRGTDGNWYKDGKKLFILAGWNYPDDYNQYYNIVTGVPADGRNVFFYNAHTFLGIGKIKADIVQGKLTPALKEFYQKKIDMCKDNPLLFGHFLCDEPDIAGYTIEGFRTISEYLVELDPYHPFMISPGSEGLIDFADSAEISGFHCYPKVERTKEMANFNKIVFLMERGMEAFSRRDTPPTITYLHQGFDYSDSGNTDTRVPTYDEFRSQNILALILGSKGLMHYNRGVDNFPELYIGMEPLTHEQKIIGNEAIIEPDAVEPIKTAQSELRLLAKRNATTGEYWVLACNASYNEGDYAFTFEPFHNRKVQVLSESRELTVGQDAATDHFKPFEVHVYTTSQRDFGLLPVAEIKAKIAAEYAERRKQNEGNLLYQEHENETVKVTASTNKFTSFRSENSLWHLADGLVGDMDKPAIQPTARGIVIWQDNTPNAVPDDVTLTFNEPKTIGRIEVYPAQNSLKDYELQLKVNGEFKTVGKVSDASGPMQTVTFPAIKAEALKLLVTANRGAYTKVYEIKAFAK